MQLRSFFLGCRSADEMPVVQAPVHEPDDMPAPLVVPDEEDEAPMSARTHEQANEKASRHEGVPAQLVTPEAPAARSPMLRSPLLRGHPQSRWSPPTPPIRPAVTVARRPRPCLVERADPSPSASPATPTTPPTFPPAKASRLRRRPRPRSRPTAVPPRSCRPCHPTRRTAPSRAPSPASAPSTCAPPRPCPRGSTRPLSRAARSSSRCVRALPGLRPPRPRQ